MVKTSLNEELPGHPLDFQVDPILVEDRNNLPPDPLLEFRPGPPGNRGLQGRDIREPRAGPVTPDRGMKNHGRGFSPNHGAADRGDPDFRFMNMRPAVQDSTGQSTDRQFLVKNANASRHPWFKASKTL